MDILNKLPDERYAEADDLLAFVSIYDDEARTRAWRRMLRRNRELIEGKVVLEAGCGRGVFSAEMSRLGARRVYAVEVNPLMHELAAVETAGDPAISLVRSDIRDFVPPEPIDLLVHDFFGPMLYDEDLAVLDELAFAPRRVLPDRALLRYGWGRPQRFCDDVVTPAVLDQLRGVLVSGLFDDDARLRFRQTAAAWRSPGGLTTLPCGFGGTGMLGDVLYFGLEIYDGETLVGRSGGSSNWSYVFTPRAGNRFSLAWESNGRFMETVFAWVA